MKKLLLLACIVLTSSNQSRGSIIPTSLGIVYGYTSTTLILKSIIKNKDLIKRQNKFIQCLISLPVVTIPAGLQVVLGKIFFSSTKQDTIFTVSATVGVYLAIGKLILSDNQEPALSINHNNQTPKPSFLPCELYELSKEERCSICLDDFSSQEEASTNAPNIRSLILFTNCPNTTDSPHMFHEHCINEWLKVNPTCPLCRRNVNQKQLKTYTKEKPDTLSYTSRCSIQ